MAIFAFNFRKTPGYRTDDAVGTMIVSAIPPTKFPKVLTSNSVNYTVGYVGGTPPFHTDYYIEDQARDRSLTIDPRLAGVIQGGNNNKIRIQLTLPRIGQYKIRLAAGDALYACTQTIKIYDDGVLRHTVANAITTNGNNFIDVNGNIYTAANWPANNTSITLNFTTTNFTIILGPDTGTASTTSSINHLSFEEILPPQSITSINNGNGLTPGSTNNTAVLTDFSSVPTSGSVSGIPFTNISGTPTNVTFDLPNYITNAVYPEPGISHNVNMINGSETATKSVIFNPPTNYNVVSIIDPDNTNIKTFGAKMSPLPLSTDKLIYQSTVDVQGNPVNITVNPDTGGQVETDQHVMFDLWHWVRSTGVMYNYTTHVYPAVERPNAIYNLTLPVYIDGNGKGQSDEYNT